MNVYQINCSDFVGELSNLLDGDVSSALRANLEAHLAICKSCTVIFDTTRKTIKILADANTFELPANELKASTDQIMARIRAIEEGSP